MWSISTAHPTEELLWIQQQDLLASIRHSHGYKMCPQLQLCYNIYGRNRGRIPIDPTTETKDLVEIHLWHIPHMEPFRTRLEQVYWESELFSSHHQYGLPFLDTFIYKENNELKIRVYYIPTDNKQYLHYTSCHPQQYQLFFFTRSRMMPFHVAF